MKLGDCISEQLAKAFLGAPLDRGAEARGRWHMLANHLEHVPDVALGRVVDDPDLAFGPGDPGKFGCGSLLLGANIEPKTDVTTSKLSSSNGIASASPSSNCACTPSAMALTRPLEQRWHVVDADDLATAACRGEGRIPAAGRDVEHAVGGMDVERLDQLLEASRIWVPIM